MNYHIKLSQGKSTVIQLYCSFELIYVNPQLIAMASMDMMNHSDAGHSAEPHVKYNNFVDSEDSPAPSGKGPLSKLKK